MKQSSKVAAANLLKIMRSGRLRVTILRMLSERKMHGYELMNDIRAQSFNFMAPKSGTIYPILRDLEAKGNVLSRWDSSSGRRKKRIYEITKKGRDTLRDFDALRRNLRKKVRQDVTRISKLLEIDLPEWGEPGRDAMFGGFWGGGRHWQQYLQGADSKSTRERKEYLQRGQKILEARIALLKEIKATIDKQLEAMR